MRDCQRPRRGRTPSRAARDAADAAASAGASRRVEKPVRITTLGDLVLDVIVTGELGASRDAKGAVRIVPGGSAANFAAGAARAVAGKTLFGRGGDDVTGRPPVAAVDREG